MTYHTLEHCRAKLRAWHGLLEEAKGNNDE